MAAKNKITKDFYNRVNTVKGRTSHSFDSALTKTSMLPSNFRYHYTLKKCRKSLYINGSLSIIHNRCVYSGNSRSVSRFFRLSRMVFKYLAVNGLLTGLSKHSWWMHTICSFIGVYNLALLTGRFYFSVRYTKSIELICKLLLEKGYVSGYRIILSNDNTGQVKIIIHILSKVVKRVHLVSTPSKRVRLSYLALRKYYSFMGEDSDLILRTSKGFQYGSTCLRLRIGGEVLFRLN